MSTEVQKPKKYPCIICKKLLTTRNKECCDTCAKNYVTPKQITRRKYYMPLATNEAAPKIDYKPTTPESFDGGIVDTRFSDEFGQILKTTNKEFNTPYPETVIPMSLENKMFIDKSLSEVIKREAEKLKFAKSKNNNTK